MWNECPFLMSLSEIVQCSFKLYRNQTTIESSKLGTMYIFWGEKFASFVIFPKFGNLTIFVTS